MFLCYQSYGFVENYRSLAPLHGSVYEHSQICANLPTPCHLNKNDPHVVLNNCDGLTGRTCFYLGRSDSLIVRARLHLIVQMSPLARCPCSSSGDPRYSDASKWPPVVDLEPVKSYFLPNLPYYSIFC